MTRPDDVIAAHHQSEHPSFVVEAEYCSTRGRRAPNEDYALCRNDVGMCVADGIGGAPLGGAMSRYACHVAMDALQDGKSAIGALEEASEHVSHFLDTVDLPRSGTSLVVAKLTDGTLDAAWAGFSALFVLVRSGGTPLLYTSLDRDGLASTRPLGHGQVADAGTVSLPMRDIEALTLCTDGVWRCLDAETIARLLAEDAPPRKVAARIVFSCQSLDDSTALVARIRQARAPHVVPHEKES